MNLLRTGISIRVLPWQGSSFSHLYIYQILPPRKESVLACDLIKDPVFEHVPVYDSGTQAVTFIRVPPWQGSLFRHVLFYDSGTQAGISIR